MFYQIALALILAYVICNSRITAFADFKRFYSYLGTPFHICLALYVLFHVIIGDRGPVIVCASMYFGTYLISVSRTVGYVRLTVLSALTVFALFVIGQTRSMSSDMDFSHKLEDVIDNTTMSKSVMPFTDELAGCVQTLHVSVENVPDYHPHVYGVFLLRTIASWIPFSDRIISSFIPLDPRYRNSAFFITWLIQGEHYTYGNGSSCNADLYLGFGIWGVILGLLLWGVFLRYLESVAVNKSSVNFWIIFMFTLGYAVYVNRSDLLVYGNYVIFTILFNYIWRLFYNKR